MDKPRLIALPEIVGKHGNYSVLEFPDLPFSVQRVYWVYNSKPGMTGGNHAHLRANRVLVCVKGKAEVSLESSEGTRYDFSLDRPSKGLFFPKLHWITYSLIGDAILMVLVDTLFHDDVKIEDYANFKRRKP
jgi:hypothetical protein